MTRGEKVRILLKARSLDDPRPAALLRQILINGELRANYSSVRERVQRLWLDVKLKQDAPMATRKQEQGCPSFSLFLEQRWLSLLGVDERIMQRRLFD